MARKPDISLPLHRNPIFVTGVVTTVLTLIGLVRAAQIQGVDAARIQADATIKAAKIQADASEKQADATIRAAKIQAESAIAVARIQDNYQPPATNGTETTVRNLIEENGRLLEKVKDREATIKDRDATITDLAKKDQKHAAKLESNAALKSAIESLKKDLTEKDARLAKMEKSETDLRQENYLLKTLLGRDNSATVNNEPEKKPRIDGLSAKSKPAIETPVAPANSQLPMNLSAEALNRAYLSKTDSNLRGKQIRVTGRVLKVDNWSLILVPNDPAAGVQLSVWCNFSVADAKVSAIAAELLGERISVDGTYAASSKYIVLENCRILGR